jgi:ABC-2 type transport system permease protein/lipopolysaccharide transport system permease protein
LWAVLVPLAMLGVGAIVFGRVAKVDTGTTPYALFAAASLPAWVFFANSLVFGIPSVGSYPTMVQRFAFPRATIPLSMVGASLLDLGIALCIFGMFALAMGNGLPITALWVPVLVLIELPLVVGMVLLGSALNVFARDFRLAVPLVTQLLLFITPVMYPLDSADGGLRTFFMLNPMTGIVESFRDVLVIGSAPSRGLLTVSIVGALLALAVGTWYFDATESRFADVI